MRGPLYSSAAYKAKVAVEALKERESLAELSKRFEVHPTMFSKWKQEFLQNFLAAFEKEQQSPNHPTNPEPHIRI